MSSFVGINMNKASYLSCYEFRKDPQKEASHSILNRQWLPIKPRVPPPWDDSFVQSALLMLSQKTRWSKEMS